MQDKDSGSFVSGFGMGIITGMAAYFLFGTDQGKDLRKKILSEWDTMQTNLSSDSDFQPPKQLRQVVSGVLKYFSETVAEMQKIEEKAEKKTLPARSKTDTKAKATSRFKGV